MAAALLQVFSDFHKTLLKALPLALRAMPGRLFFLELALLRFVWRVETDHSKDVDARTPFQER